MRTKWKQNCYFYEPRKASKIDGAIKINPSVIFVLSKSNPLRS
jgi:cystathionine beta-lyase/cystathionine gamma-synthase